MVNTIGRTWQPILQMTEDEGEGEYEQKKAKVRNE